MDRGWSRLTWGLISVVLLCVLASTPAVASDVTGGNLTAQSVDAGSDDQLEVAGSEPTIDLEQRLSLVPEEPGVYAVEHRYELPDAVGVLEVTPDDDAMVRSTDGFVAGEDGAYEWDRSTEEPRVTYQMPANRTVDADGPITGPGRYTFVDTGDWALVPHPGSSHRWGWSGTERVGFERTVTAEEGETGESIAFLGEVEAETYTAHGQEFRLIVPEVAEIREHPEDIFDSLAGAADRLRVGERDESVFIVAAPTDAGVEWGVRGLQAGDADMWVRDHERLADPDNVWLHEYVHTRQGYDAATDLQWFSEGTATYYAAVLSLEQELITFEEFSERLSRGEGRFGGSVLTEPGSWRPGADYHVGALVAGSLDRQIQETTDREHSFQDVFRALNEKDDVATHADLRRGIRSVSDSETRSLADSYLTTTERPSMWTEQEHLSAFTDTPAPAQITTAFTDEPARVAGPYRNRSLSEQSPVVLVPGERLTLNVRATNHGETSGTSDVPLRIDNEPVANQTVDLEPGESGDLTFEHAFESVGTYTVTVGDVSLPLEVRKPAEATVTAFTTNRTSADLGDEVAISAEVGNDAADPGERTLTVTANGEPIHTETVRLDAASNETVTTTTRLNESGEVVFGLEDGTVDPVVVTVNEVEDSAADEQAVDDSPATDDRDDDATPGFGPLTAAVALAVALGLTARHQS